MSQVEQRPPGLVGLTADASLLGADPSSLPSDIPRPAPGVPSRAPIWLARCGAAMATVARLGGVALVALSAIELIAGSVALSGGALVLGVLLVGTHRWWARAASANAGALEDRHERRLITDRRHWLEAIEPYARFEISTAVAQNGSIEIVRSCYSPVRAAGEHFRFERAIEQHERHGAEEPSDTVVERAEELRREAALDTERARERYLELFANHGEALLSGADEDEHRATLRAASGALSEQINANLRDPPLRG